MKNRLVIYDVRDPKRLSKIAKIMLNYGVRVQKSVFEMDIDDKTFGRLRKEIISYMEIEDYVVFFSVCERDWQKRMKFGPEKFEEPNDKPFHIL